MIAAEKGYWAMGSVLIQFGADLNLVDSHGMTALDYEKQSGWTNWNKITNCLQNPNSQHQSTATEESR